MKTLTLAIYLVGLLEIHCLPAW